MPSLVYAVGRPEVPPCEMPDRFRTDVAYFMTPAGTAGIPAMGPGEYWIALDDARRWLDDGCFEVVSPLDSESKTEIELTEDQERWLEWLLSHQIQHVRVTG